ncbi:unnamed protein product [Mytilus coruscus]|uniref:C-type lectin domain-containing protein n=1 Tax=Mytilus coruscus TaxID=42192 RepID=A0A6J8C5P9_MYTCO|nr:unnamed protein product [Mytilus coruscus]
MKSWEITLRVVRSTVIILLLNTLCLAKLNTKKQGFINTKDRKIIPSSSTLKTEIALSSIACSTLCCMMGSCCYVSYDKKTRQCILEESCCPQSELSGDAIMMKKSTAFWLGGTDIEKEGDWIWSTSQTDIIFNDWSVGQPSNSKGEEHCLQMKLRYNLKWNDDPCTEGKRFICEKKEKEQAVLFTGCQKQDIKQLGNDARNCAVLDSACSSTDCERQKLLKFRGRTRLKSVGEYDLPICIVGEEVKLKTDFFYSDIPLFLSRSAMKKAGVKINLENDTAIIMGKKVSLNLTSSGHYCIPIDKTETLKVEK